MRSAASAAHALGWLIAIATLVVNAGPTFAQSSPTPPQPSPQSGPVAQEPTPDPPTPAPSGLSLSDRQRWIGVKEKPLLESWLSGVEVTCTGCRGFEVSGDRPEPAGNAPWSFQGTWRRDTALGAVSAGVVGVRNQSLPLSTIMPIGGKVDVRGLGTSLPGTSQWALTASLEKPLFTVRRRVSISVVADALVPVSTDSPAAGDPRVSAMSAGTVRAGIRIRW